jgi:hypothetical protein
MPIRVGTSSSRPRRLIIAMIAVPVTMLLLCGCSSTSGQPAAVPPTAVAPALSLAELSLRISTFHSSPTQASFSAILGSFQLLSQDRADAALMATFIVFATERFHLSTEGEPDSLPLTVFRSLSSATLLRWLDHPATSPEKNDVLWMGFFATGDEQYLDRLAAIATSFDPTRRTGDRAVVIDLAAASALWSYKSNAAQWPEVHAHAERMAAAGIGFAKECLDYAAAHPELMHR